MCCTVIVKHPWCALTQEAHVLRSLWASVQGNPLVLQRVHGWLTVFWIVLIPIAELTSWVNANGYISRLSEVALVLGSWSAWQAARVEVKQDEQGHDESGNNAQGQTPAA